jgi:galactokinase
MAFGVVWNEMAGLGLDNKTLALLAQKCENQFVGVNCGIMDQMASAMGREGHAMFLDTRSLDITYSPIPSDLAILLCDTKVPRALSDSAYNQRRRECEEAAQAMGVKALRDATVGLLEQSQAKMSGVVYRRARHVITENDRCLAFRDALSQGDPTAIGELMKASHESLRDDYEVSCRELDIMAEVAWNAPGCVGARMTGAGFGGACVAIVHENQLQQLTVELLGEYERRSGRPGELISCSASKGASLLRV